MNVEIGTEAPIFLLWEYLFQIFGILSLQCTYLQGLFNQTIFDRIYSAKLVPLKRQAMS